MARDEDSLIEGLIAAATDHFDGWAGVLGGRALIAQTWAQSFPGFAPSLRLALSPAIGITGISYINPEGASQSFDVAGARLHEDAAGPYVCFTADLPQTDIRADAVTITYRAGYGDAAGDVPAPLRQAILLLVGHWYAQREAVGPSRYVRIPFGVMALSAPYRRLSL